MALLLQFKQILEEGEPMRNEDKIILDLAGGTGAWSRPYKQAGYTVINVTLPEYDVRTYQPPENVYGILAAPPCTMFSLARTRAKTPRDFQEGMEIVKACLEIIWQARYKKKLKFWCLENPRAFLRQFLGKPFFTFKPCWFGDPGGKPTDLWGYFQIPKIPFPGAIPVRGRYNTESAWYNTTVGNLHRSITPEGFAKAFYESNQ